LAGNVDIPDLGKNRATMMSILTSIGYFVIASIIARGLGFVKSFWLARVLGPSDYGVWVFVLLLTAYAPILTLGTVEALIKKVPFLNGKGDRVAVQATERAVFTFTLLVSLLFVVSTLFVPLVLTSENLRKYVLPTRLMLLAVSLSMLSSFYYFRLQAYNKFGLVSSITTARSVLTIVLQIGLSYRLGLTGAVVGYMLSEVVVCAYSVLASRTLRSRLGLRFSLPLYRALVTTGLPITIVWWTFMIQTTADRLVSMWLLGEAATGYYGIGMSMTTAYLLLPDAINQVLYPSVNEKYGKRRRAEDLIPLVVDPARIMSLILPFLTYAFVLVLPLVFVLTVPQYMPGLVAAQILIVGALFSGLTRGGVNLLIAVDRQRILLALVIGSVVMNVLGNVVLVRLGLNIAGIALSTAFCGACLAFAIWFLVFQSIGFSLKGCLKSTIELFAPALIFTLLAIANRVLLNVTSTTNIMMSLLFVGVQLAVYCAAIFAIPRYRRRMGGAFKFVVKAMRERLEGKRQSTEQEGTGGGMPGGGEI
jgi:O-antigen/teichoic acid export membrane protein